MVASSRGVEYKTYYHRHLPHYQPPEATYHVVFRLAGSLPAEVIERLRIEREAEDKRIAGFKDEARKREQWREHQVTYFEKFEALLDSAATGPRWLSEGRIAGIVAESLRYRDTKQYELLAYTIMPNHVHMVLSLLYKPKKESVGRRVSSTYTLTTVLENLKWYTALQSNRLLARRGAFWQHESYDHVHPVR